jgi:ABC-type transport system involved in multi-copper enzyme maturation permease subunit
MRRALAIAWLTFSEGVRMRIVLVFLIILVFLVLRMPFALRGDETLTGRLQSFLAYSLGALGLLLSLTTVFFACATLTGEIKECSLQLVVTKPVARFQILLGKWLGVNLLNLLIVVLCGGAIYGFAHFIRSRPQQFERDRLQLRDVVWTARVAARPVVPAQEIAEAAAQYVEDRIHAGEIDRSEQAMAIARRIGELKNRWRSIENGDARLFEFKGLAPPEREDTVIQIRYKARGIPIPRQEQLAVGWVICDPKTRAPLAQRETREHTDDTHQFLLRAGPAIQDGALALLVFNPYDPSGGTTIYFDGDASLEVLYKVGGFEANFVKGLLMILLQLALLSGVGLFFSTFVSFPVACLCTCAFYLFCAAMPFLLESIGVGQVYTSARFDPYGTWGPAIRLVLVPFMQAMFPDFGRFSGTRYLVDGEYIPFALLGSSLLRTLVYGGVLLLLPGWLIFRRREIAEVIV